MILRILHVSDIHGKLDVADKIAKKAREEVVDLIIIAGDITHKGSTSDAERILRKIAFSEKEVFFVSGNCDPTIMLSWRPSLVNIKNLHGRKISFKGINFLGLGGGSGKFGTPTEFTEEEFSDILIKKPSQRNGWKFRI